MPAPAAWQRLLLHEELVDAERGADTMRPVRRAQLGLLLQKFSLSASIAAALYALALYTFWRGFEPALQARKVSLRFFALSGLALGLSAYVYTVSRGLFGVFVMFALYLLIFRRSILRRTWRGLGR